MKYSNTALKNLSARYGKVLRKCAYLNAIVLTAIIIANPAMAAVDRSKLEKASETSVTTSDLGTITVTNKDVSLGDQDKVPSVFFISKGTNTTIGDGSFFENNLADSGVFSTSGSRSSLTVGKSEFKNNEALFDGGAIANFGDLTVNGTTFTKNTAQTLYANDDNPMGGGAIALGALSKTTITNATFTDNTSLYNGGAIATRDPAKDNSKATLALNNSTFNGNTASNNGGVIYNAFYNSVVFTDNTFSNNSAGNLGGAIYNDTPGVITLSGTNVFSGNTAAGVANDIHNLGTLNISGDLTLDGGITGNGSVVFKEGSTLKTTLNNSTALISGNTVSGTTSLVIDNGITNAELKMFDTTQDSFNFADNSLYNIDGENGTYTISKKSTEAITETLISAGVSETAATTVAAITEAQPTTAAASSVANAIAAAAQTGDTATVAALTEAINPVETPVVQQQSVAVANQIFSVAGDRMSGVGRSGGDINVTVGPWIQGLYNKTHNTQGNGFNGYSQGFALGLDFDVCKNFMWGFGYGYTATDVKSGARKTQIYSDNIFMYGKYQPNKWYVSGIANYGHSNYKETSLGLISKYNVDSYSAAANVGYQSGIFDNYAGLRYSYITPDSYSNGLTTVEGKNSQVGTAVIGTKISKAYKTKGAIWKPEIRLAATYDVKSDNSSSIVGVVGSTTNYMVEGKRLKRFAVEAGAGITTTVARNLDISFNYDANLRSKQTSQSGSVKLKYSF